jgi:hypothetical protein
MVMSPVELEAENDCAGEGKQQFTRQTSYRVTRKLVPSKNVSTEAEESPWLAAIT